MMNVPQTTFANCLHVSCILSLLFTFIIIVYAEPKKIQQRQYAFICNLLAFNLFIISLHLFCEEPSHFILSCLVLASFRFPISSVENFHERKASFWTSVIIKFPRNVSMVGEAFSMFSNFVKRGIKILDILGLSNAVRQQQQQQNGAHDWVAHSTRKSQHTHTHTLRYIYRYRYICLSAFLYVSIIILCYLQASFLSQATSKVKSFPERSENGTQEENLVQK